MNIIVDPKVGGIKGVVDWAEAKSFAIWNVTVGFSQYAWYYELE